MKQSSKNAKPIKHKAEVDWEDKYMRAMADYQNLERRIIMQAAKNKNEANRELLLQLLEILDDIEKAQIFVDNEGLKLIKVKLITILEKNGVTEIKFENNTFDPNIAEVVSLDSETPQNIISAVLQKGYMLGEMLLRPAQVQVGQKLTVPSD